MKQLFTLLFAVFTGNFLMAQNVGIGTTNPLDKVDVDGSLRLTGTGRLVKFETGIATVGVPRYIPGISFIRPNGTELGKIEYVDTVSFANFMRIRMGNDFENGITLNSSNNIGMGTVEPLARLHVRGAAGIDEIAINSGTLSEEATIQFYSAGIGMLAAIKKTFIQLTDNDLRLGTNSNNDNGKLIIRTNGTDRLFVDSAGNIAIGNSYKVANGYKLSVNGKIMSEEVRVQMDADWPDYVFEDRYNLLPLSILQEKVMREKHLPGIPSAAEVKAAAGIELGDMQKRLLEKIEEMYRYLFQLNSENQALKKEMEQLKKQLRPIE